MHQIVGKQIGPIGFGMMGLTTKNPPISIESAIQALRAALEAGCNFWNAGQHYGTPEHNSLTLLATYFKKYPEDASKVVLMVKGAFDIAAFKPDCSPEGIKRSMDKILKDLDGTKKVDIFECARADPDVPLEVTLGYLEKEYVNKGIIGGIALSEVKGSTIRRAVKSTKIVAVEVELSLWSTHVLENGAADACAEFDIPLVAYSPIGKGMLSGEVRSLDDLHEDDPRRVYPRFQPETFNVNLQLVDELTELAKRKGCTPSQLAINWTIALSKASTMPVVIPIPGATLESRIRENAAKVEITQEEMAAINTILAKATVVGGRYPAFIPKDG